MPKLPIIICMILVLSLWPVEARTYIVGNDGLATHKSIGEAISAASAGDTVYMKSGVYKEEVTIDKKIAIKPLTGERGTILMDGSAKGTGITLTASGCSIEGLTFKNFTKAGIIIHSNDNTIKNNQFIDDKPGIMIQGSANNKIEGNSMKDCVTGVVLWQGASHNEISKNNIEGGIASVTIKGAGWNVVTNNTLSNGGAGVALENSSKVAVSRNIIKGGINGVIVYNSSECNLTDNIESGNKRAVYVLNTTKTELYNESIRDGILGIVLENSNYNIIRGCTVDNTTEALSLGASSRNVVTANSILNTKNFAIEIVYSNGNALMGNRLSHADTGVNITESSGNRVEDNKLKDINLGMIVLGGDKQSFDNAIEESNTEDGKPIAYFFGQSNKVVQGRELSHLTLAYCNNFTLKNNTISNDALLLFSSRSSKITGNNVSKCHGMVLQDSISNEISKNIVIGNSFSGIFLFDSGSNTVSENVISKNHQNGVSLRNSSANAIQGNIVDRNLQTGVWLNDSNGNKIFENTVSNNPVGILIIDSSSNQVYHNNLLNNTQQAEDRNGMNRWDGGNGTGGNYWSDHKVMGNPSKGPSKVIKGSKMDNNPYQNENGWTLIGSAVKAMSVNANLSQLGSQEKALLSINQSTKKENNQSTATKSISAIQPAPSSQTKNTGTSMLGNKSSTSGVKRSQPATNPAVFKI